MSICSPVENSVILILKLMFVQYLSLMPPDAVKEAGTLFWLCSLHTYMEYDDFK